MTNLGSVKREVNDLRNRVLPKPEKDTVIVWCFGSENEPHGKYHFRKQHILTGKCEPLEEHEEIELLRNHYDS